VPLSLHRINSGSENKDTAQSRFTHRIGIGRMGPHASKLTCMRLFIGIPLGEPVAAELTRLIAWLRPAATNLRWSASESWHITLQFLGNTTMEQFDCVVARLKEVQSPPIPIQLAGVGIFDRAGIFYAGVELTPRLAALQQRIAAATAPCGFELEARPYNPHITLARAKAGGRAQELRSLLAGMQSQPQFSRYTAAEFLFYESHPSSTGSRYEIRHRFPLGGGK
jgi:RNA 2',3'-cyclic 3'-phosphodiesterase